MLFTDYNCIANPFSCVSGGYSTHPVSVLKVLSFIASPTSPEYSFEAHSCKREINGPPSAKQDLSTAVPSHGLAISPFS